MIRAEAYQASFSSAQVGQRALQALASGRQLVGTLEEWALDDRQLSA